MVNYPIFPDIPVSIRNRNVVVGGTSAINYGASQFGMPIDLVVPWDLPYIHDDRAKITVGAQTGTVSFGRQVGTRYRMAHIRGIQIGADTLETGTITPATAVDQQPPAYSAGDAAFQAWFYQNWPSIEFGDRTDRRGSWRPTGGAGSMTKIDVVELEPGRTVLKGWGRVPNARVFKTAEIRNMNANSLMFMWWCYFWPETALVKWELHFFYCDANNGARNIYTLPEMSIGVVDRLHLDVKWRNQRLVDAGSRDTYTLPGRRFHDFIDVPGRLAFGQGAAFTGHFLDTSRLAHTEQDYKVLTDYDIRASTYQYWINAIADRATWLGKTPVWGNIPTPATSIVDPLVYDAQTIDKYQAMMNSPSVDPVFDSAKVLWAAIGEGGNPAGDQGDYGHGKAAMYWGLNPAGNPDAIELGVFGLLPLFGVIGKFYHQGPDEPQRTDRYAPGVSAPGHNKVDGSLYDIDYPTNPNGTVDMDQFWLYTKTAVQDFRVPNQNDSDLVWNWLDPTGRTRGVNYGNEQDPIYGMSGTDTSHASNWGLLYANVTTGSWMMLELMRQQTVMFRYATHPWGHDTVTVLMLEQHRAMRTFQCIVNGYWAEHDPTRRSKIHNHLRVVFEKDQAFAWSGFQPWRESATAFYEAPDRLLAFNSGPSSPNVNPPLAYSMANPWQMGAFTGAWGVYNIIQSPTMRDWMWAGWYSFLRYMWENFAVHPEEDYLRALGQNLEADRQAAKCPGWLLMAYLTTPGITQGNPFGGDGFGPDTPHTDWLTGTKTSEGDTRNFRTWYSGMPTNNGRIPQRTNARDIIACTTGTTPTITLNAAHGLTGTFLIYFTGMFYDIDETNSRVLSGYTRVTATGAATLQIAAGYVDIYRAAAPGFLGDVEWGTVISISASATPVVELSAAHGRTGEFWVYFQGTSTVPALAGYYLCSPTGPTQITLEPGQITTTQAGVVGDVQWGTPWEAPNLDTGLQSQAPFNIWRDSRRYHTATVDWDSFYGVSATRVGRLVAFLRPNEVERNNFMMERIDDILGSWNPRYHARDYTVIADPLARWMAVVRDMDWVWPTSYEPGSNEQFTVQPVLPSMCTAASVGAEVSYVEVGGGGGLIHGGAPIKGLEGQTPPGRDLSGGERSDSEGRPIRPADVNDVKPTGTVPQSMRRGRLARRRDMAGGGEEFVEQ